MFLLNLSINILYFEIIRISHFFIPSDQNQNMDY